MGNEREELIKKLTDIISRQTGWTHAVDCASLDVADFILNREKKLMKQIEELKEKAWKYDELCK